MLHASELHAAGACCNDGGEDQKLVEKVTTVDYDVTQLVVHTLVVSTQP